MSDFTVNYWTAKIGDGVYFEGKPCILTNAINLNRKQKMITVRGGKEKITAIINKKNHVISVMGEKSKVGG